jgi:signal transduction histidine kinase
MHALLPLAEEAMEAALAAGASTVRWTNRIPTGLQVYADADQLLRILVNIGRNAVQALDDRANALVTLKAWQQGQHRVAIEIADNGPGIPDGVRNHLFEPFSSKGRIGGSGLGLAIARELARAHGGDVTLVKSDANGTMFRIDMPARPPADQADT